MLRQSQGQTRPGNLDLETRVSVVTEIIRPSSIKAGSGPVWKDARRIAVYGKGGIGKSTIIANLAVLFGKAGLRVLLIGCDPKHDTSYKVCDEYPLPTVMGEYVKSPHNLSLDDFVIEGRCGITCIESGGPEPGIGCAGRGLSKMFELFETRGLYEREYDVVLYDVLGDVVCGGFAIPMRRSQGAQVMVVVSGEIMSLYAANNICRALQRLRGGGARLLGLAGNLAGINDEETVIQAFADRLGSRVLHCIPRDETVAVAERERRTVVESAPDSILAGHYRRLYDAVSSLDSADGAVPKPMSDLGFDRFIHHTLYDSD